MGFFSMSTWENLMLTWDFFANIMLGKKSHVDMGKSHVNDDDVVYWYLIQ